jgi:hypothetical protein
VRTDWCAWTPAASVEEQAVATVNVEQLESKVRAMYRQVAEEPAANYHFEMGDALARRLGYPGDLLDMVPAAAVESIVTEQQLTDAIVSDADLWASCIGGAAQLDTYRKAIEDSGLQISTVRENDYHFISQQARNASAAYGVKSISVLAVKPDR